MDDYFKLENQKCPNWILVNKKLKTARRHDTTKQLYFYNLKHVPEENYEQELQRILALGYERCNNPVEVSVGLFYDGCTCHSTPEIEIEAMCPGCKTSYLIPEGWNLPYTLIKEALEQRGLNKYYEK